MPEIKQVEEFEHIWVENGSEHKQSLAIEKIELWKGLFRRNIKVVLLAAIDRDDRVVALNLSDWHYDRKTHELTKVVSHLSYKDTTRKKKKRQQGREDILGATSAMIANAIQTEQIPVWYSSYFLTNRGRRMYVSSLPQRYSNFVTSTPELGFFGVRHKVTPIKKSL